MKTNIRMAQWSICFFVLFVFTSCNRNKPEPGLAKSKNSAQKQEKNVLATEEEATPLATINAPDYEVKIYGAFAFAPDDFGTGLLNADSGSQFVVFDMSVLNTSVNKVVDMGKILLTAKITDEKGNVYPHNPLAVKAFEIEYPEPQHKSQYHAIRGKIQPGKYYRTTAYGIEAPVQIRNFIIALSEDGNALSELKVREVKFSLD